MFTHPGAHLVPTCSGAFKDMLTAFLDAVRAGGPVPPLRRVQSQAGMAASQSTGSLASAEAPHGTEAATAPAAAAAVGGSAGGADEAAAAAGVGSAGVVGPAPASGAGGEPSGAQQDVLQQVANLTVVNGTSL